MSGTSLGRWHGSWSLENGLDVAIQKQVKWPSIWRRWCEQRAVGRINLEADPYGNPAVQDETAHLTCPRPRGAGQGTGKMLRTAKVNKNINTEAAGLILGKKWARVALEFNQRSKASSTLNSCVILNKLPNKKSWFSHLQGPSLTLPS